MFRRLTILLAMSAALSLAQADEAAKANLVERLEETATLSADFHQETFAEGAARGEQASGRMLIARPLRFAWRVEEPYEQAVISDGETLWIHDPDLEQATHQPVENQVARSPAMILTQPEATLETAYEVTEASNDNLTAFRLYPTDPDAVFSDLTLLFENGVIREIRLSDNLGQETRITLDNVETGVGIDPAEFEFEPPPGTDVFEQM